MQEKKSLIYRPTENFSKIELLSCNIWTLLSEKCSNYWCARSLLFPMLFFYINLVFIVIDWTRFHAALAVPCGSRVEWNGLSVQQIYTLEVSRRILLVKLEAKSIWFRPLICRSTSALMAYNNNLNSWQSPLLFLRFL